MAEKLEWRKREKSLYIPKNKPELVQVPAFKFLTLRSTGSPDTDNFTHVVAALYSLSYGIKMQLNQLQEQPKHYCDYTVYPLEGAWDINDEAKKNFTGVINKEDFVYQMMIRQPDFVSNDYFAEILAMVKKKKPNPFLDEVKFETITEGSCVQMMHLGKFEDEPQSFEQMEAFATSEGLTRQSKIHREIYLSDPRKTVPEKLKTVLRFKV